MSSLADLFRNRVNQNTQNLPQNLNVDQQAQIDALEKFTIELSSLEFTVDSDIDSNNVTMALHFSKGNDVWAVIPYSLKKDAFGRQSIQFQTQSGSAMFDMTDQNERLNAANLLINEVVIQIKAVNRVLVIHNYLDNKTNVAGGP